jgi:hypothetical protein
VSRYNAHAAQGATRRLDDELREALVEVGELCARSDWMGVSLRYDEFHVVEESGLNPNCRMAVVFPESASHAFAEAVWRSAATLLLGTPQHAPDQRADYYLSSTAKSRNVWAKSPLAGQAEQHGTMATIERPQERQVVVTAVGGDRVTPS